MKREDSSNFAPMQAEAASGASADAFGERIAVARQRLGLTQRGLAAKVGRSQGYISDVEVGRADPSFDLLLKLWRTTGIDPGWIVTGDGSCPCERTMHPTPPKEEADARHAPRPVRRPLQEAPDGGAIVMARGRDAETTGLEAVEALVAARRKAFDQTVKLFKRQFLSTPSRTDRSVARPAIAPMRVPDWAQRTGATRSKDEVDRAWRRAEDVRQLFAAHYAHTGRLLLRSTMLATAPCLAEKGAPDTFAFSALRIRLGENPMAGLKEKAHAEALWVFSTIWPDDLDWPIATPRPAPYAPKGDS